MIQLKGLACTLPRYLYHYIISIIIISTIPQDTSHCQQVLGGISLRSPHAQVPACAVMFNSSNKTANLDDFFPQSADSGTVSLHLGAGTPHIEVKA